jgi:hypothetical protein
MRTLPDPTVYYRFRRRLYGLLDVDFGRGVETGKLAAGLVAGLTSTVLFWQLGLPLIPGLLWLWMTPGIAAGWFAGRPATDGRPRGAHLLARAGHLLEPGRLDGLRSDLEPAAIELRIPLPRSQLSRHRNPLRTEARRNC